MGFLDRGVPSGTVTGGIWKKLAYRGTALSNVSEEGSDGWRESPHHLRDAIKARLDLCQAATIDRTRARDE